MLVVHAFEESVGMVPLFTFLGRFFPGALLPIRMIVIDKERKAGRRAAITSDKKRAW